MPLPYSQSTINKKFGHIPKNRELFLDPKFMKISKLSNNDSSILNKLPIMGVSSLKLVDQTYIYSPSSIVGILVDRSEVQPKNIHQFKSSFDGRTILVFSKQFE